jgi:hypothetical protein
MTTVGDDGRARPRAETLLRHRDVPSREVDDKVIAARPTDGAPVVLAPTAAIVWRLLDGWTNPNDIDVRLTEVFPDVEATDRQAARAAILDALSNDDLLERS